MGPIYVVDGLHKLRDIRLLAAKNDIIDILCLSKAQFDKYGALYGYSMH